MKIKTLITLSGPSIFHYKPLIKATLDLGELAEVSSAELPGFNERLLGLLPGLHQHTCSKGYPGGFRERLETGTYLAHITEHVTIELSQLAGMGVSFGKAVWAGDPGIYDIVVRFQSEHAMKYLLTQAVELVEAVIAGNFFLIEPVLEQARSIAADTDLGPSTSAIVKAAERRNIPWRRIGTDSLVQLGYGIHRKFIQATQSSSTSSIAVDISCDKALTKSILEDSEVPVPAGVTVSSLEEAMDALEDLTPPLAVKPLDGNQGKGVTLNVTNRESMEIAFRHAQEISRQVEIEELFEGRDFRVVVIKGKVVAASERTPAKVIGDGASTIEELVEQENKNPLRGEGHEKALSKIKLDGALHSCLARQGLTLSSIPAKGETVYLRETANLSTGGTARDVTDLVHQSVIDVCQRAANAVGLDICGIDLITPDISLPLPERRAGIIEVNAAPGIRMHHHPSEGEARDVGAAIIDMLYPNGESGRIPIICTTGTNGKTTTTRLMAHVIEASGKRVGMTTTEGIAIGGNYVKRGDTTGPRSARTVLSDPTVEFAVLEVARGGITRRGLGYDWSDVGIILNVQGDHLGQDGIETIDDLIHVKSLVAERVREGGTVVINADDEGALAVYRLPRVHKIVREYVLFSLSEENRELQTHLTRGGRGYFVRDGKVIEIHGAVKREMCVLSEVPITIRGLLAFNVQNCIATIAAARSVGMEPKVIADALATFRSEANPGRFNLYRVHNGVVVLDYAHNPHALRSVGSITPELRKTRKVTGVVTIPGDRADHLLEEGGKVAASIFDRIIVREDLDSRGRRRGEIAAIVAAAALEENPSIECEIVLDEGESLHYAIDTMHDDEVIFFFYEEKDLFESILEKYRATPLQDFLPVSEYPHEFDVEELRAGH